MRLIIYYSSLVLIALSCSKQTPCPPDQVLGNLNLNTKSQEFLPYENIDSLIFTDSAGINTVILYSIGRLIHDFSKTIIGNICIEDDMRSDSFFISEHLTVDYFDFDTSRRLRIIGNVGINEDFLSNQSTVDNPVLYDELKLTVHRSNPSNSGSIATLEMVTSDRGNLNRMSDTLKFKSQRFTQIPEVKINDKMFTNVFEFIHRDTPTIYFKPIEGVVAFRDITNKWWHLKSKN